MIRVPLHHIHLQSDLVSGPVVVGVRPSLPVNGVSLILSNNLAGGKVQPNLQIVNNTKQILCPSPAVDGLSDTFPACVVTRTVARRAQTEENLPSSSQSVTLSDGTQDSAQENRPVVQDVGEV